MMTRRDLIRYLLATPLAATVDVEQLLWVPKPIVVVPAMPQRFKLWPPHKHPHYPNEVEFLITETEWTMVDFTDWPLSEVLK